MLLAAEFDNNKYRRFLKLPTVWTRRQLYEHWSQQGQPEGFKRDEGRVPWYPCPPELPLRPYLYPKTGTPSPADFNVGFYLLSSPDVAITRASEAWTHFQTHGQRENRLWSRKPELVPYWVSDAVEWNRRVAADEPLPPAPDNPDPWEYWRQINSLSWGTFDFQPQGVVWLDFPAAGGTLFYREALETGFGADIPQYRIVALNPEFYACVHNNLVSPTPLTTEDVRRLLAQLQPRVLFLNHLLTWDLSLVKDLLTTTSALVMTMLHDYFWFDHPELIPQCDLVLAPSRTMAELALTRYPAWADQLRIVPHPDYYDAGTTVSVPGGPKRIALLGGIAPKKGLLALQNLLPEAARRRVIFEVWGELSPETGFNFQPYLDSGVLVVRGYANVSQLNTLLTTQAPHVFWFHNDVNYTMETWLYTLTLALGTGLPLICNEVPIFRERAPQAIFYTNSNEFWARLPAPGTTARLIVPRVGYPLFYARLFRYDPTLYRLARLHEGSASWTESPKQLHLRYLDEVGLLVPRLTDFQDDVYYKLYHDLKDLVTPQQRYQHWLSFGQYEQRWCNQYRGLVRDEAGLPFLLGLYQRLATVPPQPHRWDRARTCALVFFETRASELFAGITRLLLRASGNRANLYVFCSESNREFLQRAIPEVEARFIPWPGVGATIDMSTYSRILKTPSFWEAIAEEHLLTYQTDSFPLGPIPWSELCSQPVGFLGAWHYNSKFGAFDINTPGGVGCNGGFSYRKRSVLRACLAVSDTQINDYRVQRKFLPFMEEIPEDAYYYHCLEILKRPLPTPAQCDAWFVQDRWDKAPVPSVFGFHGTFYGQIKMAPLYHEVVQRDWF